MRLTAFLKDGHRRLGVRKDDGTLVDLSIAMPQLPSDLTALLALGPDVLGSVREAAKNAPEYAIIAAADIDFAVPIEKPGKIICVGLNYVDHAKESPYEGLPEYPVLFTRFANSLVAHEKPIIRPINSERLDWEGEIAVIIGQKVRHATVENALNFVAGYTLFNDGSIRDYQFKSHQWLMGKSFDATGAFGPDFVTADELPPGATGLRLETRLNGETVQSATTNDMMFNVAQIIAFITEGITLEPGDVIVTGTPAGVGFARKPPRFMKAGDVCEIEVEGIGILRSPIMDEIQAMAK